MHRDIFIKDREDLKVTLFYIDGMANQKMIGDNIAFPLARSAWYDECKTQQQAYDLSINGGIEASSVKIVQKLKRGHRSDARRHDDTRIR